MTFSEALELLKQGKKVKRAIWGGFWVVQTVHGRQSKDMPHWDGEFIIAKLANGAGYAPASPYQADILAEDWEEVQ